MNGSKETGGDSSQRIVRYRTCPESLCWQSVFNLADGNEKTLSGGLACVSSPQAGAPVDAQITWMKTHLRLLRSVGKYTLLIDPRESL